MAINTIAPHIGPLVLSLVVTPITQRMYARQQVTQVELNRLMEGTSFLVRRPMRAHLEDRQTTNSAHDATAALLQIFERVPVILSTLFVTMFYGAGLPLLLPLAFVNFTITYWMDKYLLLRVYKQPPMFDESLGTLSWSLLPIALLMHLAVSAYMFAEPDVFEDENFDMSKLVREPSLLRPVWCFHLMVPRFPQFGTSDEIVDGGDFHVVGRYTTLTNFVLMNVTKVVDPLGVVPTVLRRNSVPLVGVFAAVLVLLLMYTFFGSLIAAGGRRIVYFFSGGYINIVPTQQDRSYIPPFTGEYVRELDPQHEWELTELEVSQGKLAVRQHGPSTRRLMCDLRSVLLWLQGGCLKLTRRADRS